MGLMNHQLYFLELSRGGQEGSAPPPAVDTHTHTHQDARSNSRKHTKGHRQGPTQTRHSETILLD